MVKIVQMLCKQRHCLLATAYEEERSNFHESCNVLKEMITTGPFNNYCGICGNRDLHYEEGTTKFATLKEAAPFLTEQMMKNLATREVMDQLGLTYEKQKSN